MKINKLKSGIKNGIEVILKVSSDIVGDSNDEENFLYKLLLTNTKVLRFRKAFTNNSSANIKSSKTQLRKIGQSGGFLGRLFRPSLKNGLKNLLKLLAKSVLISLGLTTVASATDAAIHKKKFGSVTATLMISNEETYDTIKIVK